MSIWPLHVLLCPLWARSPLISVAPDRRYGGSRESLDSFNVHWTRSAPAGTSRAAGEVYRHVRPGEAKSRPEYTDHW